MSLRGNATGMLEELFFGDGSDGDITVTSETSINRDVFYKNLTVMKGGHFRTNGFKVRVKETLFVKGDIYDMGVISNNGDDARNSVGTIEEVSSSVPPGTPGGGAGSTGGGGRGGAGMYNGGRHLGVVIDGQSEHESEDGGELVPAVDRATTGSFPFGGNGGNGGTAVTGSNGSGHVTRFGELAPLARNPIAGNFPNYFGGHRGLFTAMTAAVIGKAMSGSGSIELITGGTGGGAGACFNSGTIGVRPRSGWGGGGGGVLYLAARNMVISGTLEAYGGHGGNTFGVAGGGGGGGGGVVIIVYSRLDSRYSPDTFINVHGGAPGIGQTTLPTAAIAVAGESGRYFSFEV
jgi:hypothetical protein